MRNHWYIPAAVLLVLVVVGFFGGWLQLSLSQDTWGVVRINARGFEKAPINPAGFSWRVQRILPRALTLYRIPVTSQQADLTLDAALPSADAYASVMAEKPSLSFTVKLSVLYRLRPEALPDLVENEGLRAETIASWHQQLQAEIQRQATNIAERVGQGEDASDSADVAKAITSGLPRLFPQIQFISIAPTAVRMPDRQLYMRLRKAYLRQVDQKDAAFAALAPRLARQEADQRSAVSRHDASIALLTRYGELLDRYPALIKFLFLATQSKLTPRDLQTLDLLDKLPALE
jgi:hypothetical protein